MAKLAVSSVGFKNVEDMVSFHTETRVALELGVNLCEEDLEVLHQSGVQVLSVHVPCPKRTSLPNFASRDDSIVAASRDIFLESCQTALKFGCEIVVLHPGYCMDDLMPTESGERERSLQRVVGSANVVVDRAYVLNKEYKLRFATMLGNIRGLVEDIRTVDVKLACENLNPKHFYMVQTSEEIRALASMDGVNLCLDLGHLWISSLVHGFDYCKAVEEVLMTGKVVEIHASNNNSAIGRYQDSHDHLYNGAIDYQEVVEILRRFDHENFVFTVEVKDDPRSDLTFLEKIDFPAT
jgi:sugar phosphate isomerase/epimerase